MMGASPRGQTGFADYLDLLRVFDEREAEALIVGGQAVNFWAEVFEDEEPELRQYRPFTSADLDLHRPDLSAQRLLRARAGNVEAERDPFGKAFTIVSHTFHIQSKDGRVLAVDNLKTVPGLQPNEVKKGTLVVEFSGVRLRVLNPVACLKAKLHNVGAIDQRGRQDEKHVITSSFLVCVHSSAAWSLKPTAVAIAGQRSMLSSNCSSGPRAVKSSRLRVPMGLLCFKPCP
jgi:hypothetical protein